MDKRDQVRCQTPGWHIRNVTRGYQGSLFGLLPVNALELWHLTPLLPEQR